MRQDKVDFALTFSTIKLEDIFDHLWTDQCGMAQLFCPEVIEEGILHKPLKLGSHLRYVRDMPSIRVVNPCAPRRPTTSPNEGALGFGRSSATHRSGECS